MFLSLDLPRQWWLPHVSCWLILTIHSPPSWFRLLSALLDQTLGSSFITAKVFHNLWSFITPNTSQFLSHAFRNLHTCHVFNLVHLEWAHPDEPEIQVFLGCFVCLNPPEPQAHLGGCQTSFPETMNAQWRAKPLLSDLREGSLVTDFLLSRGVKP